MPFIWVADLKISRNTAEKIDARHHISGHEVKEAVVCVRRLPFTWDIDPVRGRRAIVRVNIRGPVEVVLYPRLTDAFGDVWDLGSVYHV